MSPVPRTEIGASRTAGANDVDLNFPCGRGVHGRDPGPAKQAGNDRGGNEDLHAVSFMGVRGQRSAIFAIAGDAT